MGIVLHILLWLLVSLSALGSQISVLHPSTPPASNAEVLGFTWTALLPGPGLVAHRGAEQLRTPGAKGLKCQASNPSGPSKLLKAFKSKGNKADTIAVVPEFRRDPKLIPHDLSQLSRSCREKGAAAILVDTAVEEGQKDLSSFLKEQSEARGQFPGPLPLIQKAPFSDQSQIERALKTGVQGIYLTLEELGMQLDSMREIIEEAKSIGIEAITGVSNLEQATAAVECGAQIICIQEVSGVSDCLKVLDAVPKEVISLASVPAMQPGCMELEQSRALRRAGCNGVVLSSAARDALEDTDYVAWCAH